VLQHNRTTSTCYFSPHGNFVVMSARSTSAPSGVYHPTYSRGRRDNNGDDGVSIAAGRTMAGVGIEIQPEHQRERVDTHSLRSGGANALALAGYTETQIQKMGRWKGATFKEYIVNVVSDSEDS